MSNPFDALAPSYDADFTHMDTARFLRERVQARLLTHFRAGQHILELGCGTGEDAHAIASHGVRVTATDASPAMLAIARQKNTHQPNVTVQALDMNALPHEDNARYDGAFSNFGALNCVQDRQALAGWLAQRVATGGVVAFAVMSPLCMWEMGWYALHLNLKTATRRWRANTFQPTPQSNPIAITCPRPRTLIAEFSPHFRVGHLQPLGVWLPPTALYGWLEKRPRLHKMLLQWELSAQRTRRLAAFADHYWIELVRT